MDDGLLRVEIAFVRAEAAWRSLNVARTMYIEAAVVQDHAWMYTHDTLGVEDNAWAGFDQALDAFKEVWLTATQEALISRADREESRGAGVNG